MIYKNVFVRGYFLIKGLINEIFWVESFLPLNEWHKSFPADFEWTDYFVHRCIWQALSYLNNYISFRNIYNTNRLFNKKNEYLYKINCLPSCKNIYFHLLLCLLPKRCRKNIVECFSEKFHLRTINIVLTSHIFIKNDLCTLFKCI